MRWKKKMEKQETKEIEKRQTTNKRKNKKNKVFLNTIQKLEKSNTIIPQHTIDTKENSAKEVENPKKYRNNKTLTIIYSRNSKQEKTTQNLNYSPSLNYRNINIKPRATLKSPTHPHKHT
jgi:hypothetical protein